MTEKEIKLQEIGEDLDIQHKAWDQAATYISKLFREGQPTQKEFLDRISEFIKSGKDDDVIRLVKWYYSHYVGSSRFGVEVFKDLVALGYLDVIDGKDPKCYKTEPLLLEAAFAYRHKYDQYDYVLVDEQIDKLYRLF